MNATFFHPLYRPAAIWVLIVAGLFTACGSKDTTGDTSTGLSAPQESSNMADPSVITNARSEIEFVSKRYERIERMAEEQRLACETVEYVCTDDPRRGTFRFCSLSGELVRATHEFTTGDHSGGSEVYYYDGDELFFSLLTESSWKFGSPPQGAGGSESESGTVDHVLEERRYYHEGNLIERLYKDYTVRSWETPTPPENVATARNGKEVNNGLGAAGLLAIEKAKSFGCT